MQSPPTSDDLVPTDQTSAPPPGVGELFVAFANMSLAGFGGVLVFARRAIVDEHKWMTPEEFNEAFALCHFLPGPNIVNLSVVFGSRFGGVPGALAAFLGLVGPPAVIVTTLAAIYAHYGQVPQIQRTLAGVTCAAVGLFLAVIAKMLLPILRRRDPVALTLLVAAFIAIGLLRLPLTWVLLVSIPIAIALTAFVRLRSAT